MNERHTERARSVAPLRWILKLWDLLRQRRMRGHIFDSMDGQRGSEGQLADEDDDLRVVVDQNGKRTVSWSAEIADGGPTIIQHEFPDAVRHFYQGTGVDEDVWLFQGEFSGAGGDSGYEGDVRWRWRPSPQLEARGTRPARPSDLQDALSVSGDMWIAPLALGIDLAADTLPRQPVGPVLSAPDQGYSISRGAGTWELCWARTSHILRPKWVGRQRRAGNLRSGGPEAVVAWTDRRDWGRVAGDSGQPRRDGPRHLA